MLFKNWKKEAKEWKGAAVALNKALEAEVKRGHNRSATINRLLDANTKVWQDMRAVCEAIDGLSVLVEEDVDDKLEAINEIVERYLPDVHFTGKLEVEVKDTEITVEDVEKAIMKDLIGEED